MPSTQITYNSSNLSEKVKELRVRKIGRERPILYRGKFHVPYGIVKRLAIPQNHLILAEAANFNAKVDQFYLAIDNTLSAMIIAKEGTLTTKNHKIKIEKFFNHFSRRARLRDITQEHFAKFYSLWSKSRYKLFFPGSLDIHEMGLFTNHLYEFAVTELARFYRSDETLLYNEILKQLEIRSSDALVKEVGNIHEARQIDMEQISEGSGSRLESKLLNPWIYIRASLLSDNGETIKTIDSSQKIGDIVRDFLRLWEKLVSEIVEQNMTRIGTSIANNKLKRKGRDEVMKEAVEEVWKHPDILRFRLVLNLSYDSMSAKDELRKWAKLIAVTVGNLKDQNKAHKSGWENYRLSKTKR
jgi:hypothetical protein